MNYDPEALLAVLQDEHVEYVVVGGFAAVVHGSPLPTYDVDVTPARDVDNLGRLVRALRRLDARIRTEDEPEGLPFSPDVTLLRGVTVLNLMTVHGELDLVLRPSGDLDYVALRAGAVVLQLDGLRVPIASLADVIRSKEAAGRPKDRAALPVLRALLDRTSGG